MATRSLERYCSNDDYTNPLKYALELTNTNIATNWIADITNVFEIT